MGRRENEKNKIERREEKKKVLGRRRRRLGGEGKTNRN